ncbi:amino acid permease [Thermocoleostomius sinensis]|uniref:Amino acid permease n=1 Tax=Thermocoleostomius sinensis A174 TaxID=2016057 RepID=A0A9E9C8N1_9CYAN|nr:amino acid permease [Thermocoleostomius sinensis]WAL58622.1 amino acid permease [Thermocoleostomius sinensis A174]
MQKSRGFISYEKVPDSYLRQRQLRGSANAWLLWALGVGAVISGDFYGWNYGLAVGGFWGLAIATALMAVMYICMVYSIAELSVALPHAGGFYSFTRHAFGPFLGFFCGICVAIEYLIATAAVAVTVSSYISPLAPAIPNYLVWLIVYAIFVLINIWGTDLTFYVALFITLIAILVLAIFSVSILLSGLFNPDLLLNIPPNPGQSVWLPKGWGGVFAAIPYGIWFYLAIEQLPLAAEETQDINRSMPAGLITGIYTLIVLSIFTLILNTGVGGGAVAVGEAAAPMILGLEAYFGPGSTATLITTFALICGLFASFHTIVYAYGRILFSLSRAGYLPRWLSVTGKTYTPYRALCLGAVVALICAVLISVSGDSGVGPVLVNMSVFGAVISYLLVMLSYIKLKLSHPNLPRPYQSPLGIWGAAIGTFLAMLALIACFAVPDYRPGVWGVAVFLAIATLYFFLHGKNHLVAQAPEERAALISESTMQ